MKLIVFIDPTKFNNLIENSQFKESFSTYDEDKGNTSYYETEVIYIDNQFNFDFDNYDKDKLNKNSIIILNDKLEKFELITDLEEDFYILRHTTTPPIMFERLQTKDNFKGFIQQMEAIKDKGVETIYNKLAKKIGKNNNENATEFINEFFVIDLDKKNVLITTLNFLHHCLGITESKNAEPLPKVFQSCKKTPEKYKQWKKLPNNNTLRKLRDAMLSEAGMEC